MGYTKIIDPSGQDGVRFIATRGGAQIEIVKQARGAATFEIRAYDDEERSESLIIRLTKYQIGAMLTLLQTKTKLTALPPVKSIKKNSNAEPSD